MTCKPKRPLAVWQDADQDGVAEVGELKSLADVGVQSIKRNHDAVQVAQNGNTLQGFSSFTTTDGQTHQSVDAWLTRNWLAMALQWQRPHPLPTPCWLLLQVSWRQTRWSM